MGISTTYTVAPFGHTGTDAGAAVDVRGRVERLKRMAETLMSEISRLEADLRRVEADSPLPVLRTGHIADEMHRIEATLIRDALADEEWNMAAAARRLGIKSTTFHYKLKRYGICRPREWSKR